MTITVDACADFGPGEITETSTAPPPMPAAGTRKTTLEGRELVWDGHRHRPTLGQLACDARHHLMCALQAVTDVRELAAVEAAIDKTLDLLAEAQEAL